MIIILLQKLPNLIREALREKEPENCPICIDAISHGDLATTTPCGHLFHTVCLGTWAKNHYTCPVCRGPLKGRIAPLWDSIIGAQPRRMEGAPRPNRRAPRGTRPIHNRR